MLKLKPTKSLHKLHNRQHKIQSPTKPLLVFPILSALLQTNINPIGKHNKIMLLHKKDNPIHLTYYIPLVLANKIYNLHTSTITAFLTSYGEQYRLLHYTQEGFQLQCNTSRQIQMIIKTL